MGLSVEQSQWVAIFDKNIRSILLVKANDFLHAVVSESGCSFLSYERNLFKNRPIFSVKDLNAVLATDGNEEMIFLQVWYAVNLLEGEISCLEAILDFITAISCLFELNEF